MERKATPDDLRLPVISGPLAPPSERTPDEIDAWIEHDRRYLFRREAYEREKKLREVNVRFVLGE